MSFFKIHYSVLERYRPGRIMSGINTFRHQNNYIQGHLMSIRGDF